MAREQTAAGSHGGCEQGKEGHGEIRFSMKEVYCELGSGER